MFEKLRVDVRALREEADYLNIVDPTKIWARPVTMKNKNHWHWKIFLPKPRQQYRDVLKLDY